MEERVLIVGKKRPISKALIFGITGIGLLFIIGMGLSYSGVANLDDSSYGGYKAFLVLMIILGVLCFVVGLLLWLIPIDCELTVTNKRVYGKALFGKRVDLPIDSISAVSFSTFFNRIIVSTSSGVISFVRISNNKEIHKVISDLLIERQNNQDSLHTTTIKQEVPQSNADEIKKYKELFDSGVITQEEFDAKKKQLLGL